LCSPPTRGALAAACGRVCPELMDSWGRGRLSVGLGARLRACRPGLSDDQAAQPSGEGGRPGTICTALRGDFSQRSFCRHPSVDLGRAASAERLGPGCLGGEAGCTSSALSCGVSSIAAAFDASVSAAWASRAGGGAVRAGRVGLSCGALGAAVHLEPRSRPMSIEGWRRRRLSWPGLLELSESSAHGRPRRGWAAAGCLTAASVSERAGSKQCFRLPGRCLQRLT